MVKLATWSIHVPHGEDGSQQGEPQSVGRSHIGREKHLEDWIVNDVTLIGEGFTLVGRQVSIDDGRLDLLAVDSRDRWVVIEIKPEKLKSGALAQALYYAASLARLDADELYRKLDPDLGKFGDAETLSARVKQQLDGERGEREIALLLVGTGIHPGLERMNEFLGRFGIPVGVVNFEVFELEGGPKLLIREVIDEPTKPASLGHGYTVEAISGLAHDAGVGEQFDSFVNMSKEVGLAVRPNKVSVTIAPLADRRRFLMWAGPHTGKSGGELGIWVNPKAFLEWFPCIDEKAIEDMLGRSEDGEYLAGEKLIERLEQIKVFLTKHSKHFPQPETHEA